MDGGRGGGGEYPISIIFKYKSVCFFSTKKLKPIMLKISENKFIATYGMLIAIFGFQKKILWNNQTYVGAN